LQPLQRTALHRFSVRLLGIRRKQQIARVLSLAKSYLKMVLLR
jgi:hypothetical protein